MKFMEKQTVWLQDGICKIEEQYILKKENTNLNVLEGRRKGRANIQWGVKKLWRAYEGKQLDILELKKTENNIRTSKIGQTHFRKLS